METIKMGYNIFICENHNNIIVEIYLLKENINYIRLCDKNFNYQIFIDKDSMDFYCRNKRISYKKVAVLPLDSHLTPENFEKKIKTYLTFL
jgi:hypothetical protein